MTGPLTIRPMEPRDIPAVLAIQGETGLSFWSAEAYVQALKDEFYYAHVATDSQNLVGFILARLITSEKSAEILNIAISPQFQKQSIGVGLIMRFFSDISSIIDTVFLEVREGNSGAIAFYKKHGFYGVGTRKNYYSDPVENALVMEKKLN